MKIRRKGLLAILDMQQQEELVAGAALYRARRGEIVMADADNGNIEIIVPDDVDGRSYEVELDTNTESEFDYCDCEMNEDDSSCRHVPAAAFYLLIDGLGGDIHVLENQYEVMLSGSVAKANLKDPVSPVNTVEALREGWNYFKAHPLALQSKVLQLLQDTRSQPEYMIRNSIQLIDFDEDALIWTFSLTDHRKEINPAISFDKHETYLYRCTCSRKSLMCAHVHAAFDKMLTGQPVFFLKYKDWIAEKTALLLPYGLRPDETDAKLFEFFIQRNGTLHLKPPAFYWKKGDAEKFTRFREMISEKKGAKTDVKNLSIMDFQPGFLLNLASKRFVNGFELEGLKLTEKKGKLVVNKLSYHMPGNRKVLNFLPKEIAGALEAITEEALKKKVIKEGYNNYHTQILHLGNKETALLEDYYFTQLHALWKWLISQPVYILRQGNFVPANYQPAVLLLDTVKPCFFITAENQFITLHIGLQREGKDDPDKEFRFHNNMLVEIKGVFYLPSAADRKILIEFSQGFIRMHEADKDSLVRDIIPELQKKYRVEVPDNYKVGVAAVLPKPQVLLKEHEDRYLMLQPQFNYDGNIVDYEAEPEDIFRLGLDGDLQSFPRDKEIEMSFFESLRVLHPAFHRQRLNYFYFLPFSEVMKDSWLLKMLPQLGERDIPVLGMKDLKKFRYNTNKPKWEMKAASGIDWFELQVEISFGDQVVSLLDVRKAVISGVNVVLLGDGTLGMLPEEWLKQYGLLLKMADLQGVGGLRISKLHYTLIDELYDQIDDQKVLEEIAAKKEKLKNIGNIATIVPSKEVKAVHRPYQLSGFQWMQVLDEIGWGGCLADDMGLGKTLQAITFFQYLKEKYVGSTQLVICPTSLIYNWEAELQKFGPALRYHIYYGSDRDFSEEHFENYDLVLTSYGVLRLDIQRLMRFRWNYVVLDESQAIKNPEAQVTKALQLVNSRNRLILSGTPVQNNTYDLYAQFNFINPGLLGTRDFFKAEFATPIDKENDAEKSSRLRRLVYPFLLRRTKEQVAPDLPDKTEMVLWCDLPKDQRAVYDHYKQYYRNLLLEKIAEQGMAKAGIYVLEGLLRLRQICDSPELLKTKDVKTVTSIKIQELLRELRETTGQHKILVFSQFTEMLALIRQSLEKENILYCYLDGATPAVKRSEAVQQFQGDPTYKVFLISLKAGGVGLNLTAADYVYIVDPWWNPAVEQQAIDRTHRIGQLQKIFAYRMICKDTVEEKILELQSRKKQLANDLITEDAGFIKKLGKEDIDFLFS